MSKRIPYDPMGLQPSPNGKFKGTNPPNHGSRLASLDKAIDNKDPWHTLNRKEWERVDEIEKNVKLKYPITYQDAEFLIDKLCEMNRYVGSILLNIKTGYLTNKPPKES